MPTDLLARCRSILLLTAGRTGPTPGALGAAQVPPQLHTGDGPGGEGLGEVHHLEQVQVSHLQDGGGGGGTGGAVGCAVTSEAGETL